MYDQRNRKGNPDFRNSNASESILIFEMMNPHKMYLLLKKYERTLLAQHSEAFESSFPKWYIYNQRICCRI